MDKGKSIPPRRPGDPDPLWQASQLLPHDVDRGFFVKFWLNGEHRLAWKELAAAGKAESASAEFWNLMAVAARSLGFAIEPREASLRGNRGGSVTIAVPESVALVLFEFLSREDERVKRGEHSGYEHDHPAERYAVWYLQAELEESLADSFVPTYREVLTRARNEMTEKWGGGQTDDTV